MKEKDFDDDFDDFEEGGGSIDLLPYIQLVLRNWKRLLIWALCGSLVGILIGFSNPKSYTAKAVVAPEITTRANSSGLSSLASLAGINMNSLALQDAMHPDMYPQIIRSSDFYIGLFDLPVSFTHADTLVQTDLYDYIANYQKASWFGFLAGLPRRGINLVKGLFVQKDEFEDAEGHDTVDSLRLTKQQENVIRALSKNVTATVEKKTYVLSVQVTMQDRILAAQVANAVVDHLREFVVNYRTEKAKDNVAYYEKIYEETHANYLAAQRAYAYYVDSHQGSTSLSSQVQRQHLQNEAQIKYQMYNSTAQNLLSAKAKVQQESPVLVVIQRAMAPHSGKPSKVKLALLWFFLGACAGLVWVIVKDSLKKPDAAQE